MTGAKYHGTSENWLIIHMKADWAWLNPEGVLAKRTDREATVQEGALVTWRWGSVTWKPYCLQSLPLLRVNHEGEIECITHSIPIWNALPHPQLRCLRKATKLLSLHPWYLCWPSPQLHCFRHRQETSHQLNSSTCSPCSPPHWSFFSLNPLQHTNSTIHSETAPSVQSGHQGPLLWISPGTSCLTHCNLVSTH